MKIFKKKTQMNICQEKFTKIQENLAPNYDENEKRQQT